MSNDQQREGFHSIEAIIDNNPHRLKKVFLPLKRNDKRIQKLIAKLESQNIAFEKSKKITQEPNALLSENSKKNFKDLKNKIQNNNNNKLLFLVLDNILDPRNLGACIRSAAISNVDGLIINKHHCAPINEVAHKVSVGSAELIDIFFVTNLINCIKYMKKENINIYGLSEHGKLNYTDYNYGENTAFIMGSEEHGIRQKTIETCDFKINLSKNKLFNSYNVSVATGIILSEVTRQRN